MSERALYWPELPQLVAQASTLQERLGPCFEPDVARWDADQARVRLACWQQVVAPHDPARFAQRLACDGLDQDTALRILGPVRLHKSPLPAWADTLQQAIHVAAGISLPASDPCLDPAHPIPFQDLLLPFVHVARQRLSAEPGVNYQRLPITCSAALERDLLRILSEIGAQTFLLAFSVFVCESPAPQFASTENRYYSAFVNNLRGGLRSFFQERSVLARLLAAQTDFWVEATGEFLRRLQADRPWLIADCGTGGDSTLPLDGLTSVEPRLSDPHHGGRSAIAVAFASGFKMIYKPRDLGMEAAYTALIEWLNAQGLAPQLKPLKVFNCGTHGWVEWAEHQPCQSQSEARLFYQRAGMLLALLHALQGTDYHFENLVACGEHPILVDHEMLMCPPLAPESDMDAAQALAQRQLDQSVLATGLLPRWELDPDGRAYDAGALAMDQEQTFRRLTWKNVNTDEMELAWESFTHRPSQMANRPTLNGVALSPAGYRQELLAGFQYMYRFLLAHRDALLAPDGPLAAFKGQRIRFTLRQTRLYRSLLKQTLAPRFMRDGADRSIQLDVLSRALLSPDGNNLLWPLLRAEQAALARIDIPRFTLRTDARALVLDGGAVIENCFAETGHSLALAHLARMDEQDLEQQAGFIRASLEREAISAHQGSAETFPDAPVPDMTRDEMIQAALQIAATLEECAIRSPQGITWLEYSLSRSNFEARSDGFSRSETAKAVTTNKILDLLSLRIGRCRLAPLDYDLYSGSCGVAFFLAALGRVTHEERYRPMALAALQPLRQLLQTVAAGAQPQPQPQASRALTHVGGASGLGSVIYALVRISQLADEPALLDDAQRAALLVTPERVADDQALDVVSGAAGAILGLLALHQVCATPSILERAAACGQRLLQARLPSSSGHRAWPSLDGKLLTGFSHGAAGIAYALLRLHEVTGMADLRHAAREGILYEQSVFDADARNWPDLSAEEPSFMTSWCHGAPGIGLARLGGLGILDTDDIRADVEIAVETTRRYGVQAVDHLCCGACGRAEFLLVASSRLARPELRETAHQWMSRIVSRARPANGYRLRLPSGLPQRFAPGFFQGIAGIGYELLRLAAPAPSHLPSVLLWE